MPDQAPTYYSFETPIEIHVSVTLIFDPRPEFNDDLHSFYKKLLNEGLTELVYMGLSPKEPPQLNKQTGEYLYQYIPIPFEQEKKGGAGKSILIEAEKFIPLLIHNISQGIAENKSTLDILADFAAIIGVTIPLTRTIMHLLHLDKNIHESKKTPTVTISIGDISVTATDEDLKDAEDTAMRLARRLLKEHPEALPSNKINVSGKLVDPSKHKQTHARPQQKRSKKKGK